jgi:AraC-like DNA-binding protein
MTSTPPRDFFHAVILPCRELSGFISHFWTSRWYSGVQKSFAYHSTANTNTEIVFAFSPANGKGCAPVFSSAQGHTDNYSRIDTGGISEMFGVSIYSHAIPFFFEASPLGLVNQLVDLGDIMTDVGAMTDKLAGRRDVNERVDLMTNYLKAKFRMSQRTDPAVMYAIKQIRQTRGKVSIVNLAGDVSLSQKQFTRRFKDFSGFNPKLYSRILRFESSLSIDNESSSYADVALDLGYYDQAHFINDFRKFSGSSPGKYTPITRLV